MPCLFVFSVWKASKNQWQLRETCLHPMRCNCWCLSEEENCQSSILCLCSWVEITSLSSNMPIQPCQTTISKAKIGGLALPGDSNFCLFGLLTFLSLPRLLRLQLVVSNVEKVIGTVRSRITPLPNTHLSRKDFCLHEFFTIGAKWQL